MSGRVLTISQYLNGADQVKFIEKFPSEQKTFQYDFGANIASYTFELDAQTLLVDSLTYDRVTGDPNFTDTTVVGYFANVDIGAGNISNRNNAAGTVSITIPSHIYPASRNITPDARSNVPITIFSVAWTDTNQTPNSVQAHRWAVIERYKPGDNAIGNPRLDSAFIPIGTGAISAFTSDASTDTDRTAGTYNVTGLSGGDSEGTGAQFQIVVDGSGVTTLDITNRGQNYIPSDTIEILDSSLGGGGAADITITVSSVS
jgi:hypothetical protein